jgi:hypothetical protein
MMPFACRHQGHVGQIFDAVDHHLERPVVR